MTLFPCCMMQADSGEVAVQDGDIIVLATDGVWDNFAPNLARTPTFQPVRSLCGISSIIMIGTRKHSLCLLTLPVDRLTSVVCSWQPLVAWRRNWHSEIASLVGVVTEDVAHAAENVVKAAVRHNLKPDDVTVIVAKVVKIAPRL